MVGRILTFWNREISGLHEAAYILAIFAFGSQLLALVRDRLLAGYFGAGRELDIYYAAFRIPDLIFITVASMVALSVMIPFFAERLSLSREAAKRLLDSVFSVFILVISTVSLLAFFLMPILIPIVFSGFSASEISETVFLSRLLLLSPILLGISNLFAGVTQVLRKFVIYATSPLLYNLSIIFGIIFLRPSLGILGVVLGVVLGALLHMLIQLPVLFSAKIFPSLTFSPDIALVKQVMQVSLPRTMALGTTHIIIMFLLALASVMATGSIAVFNFAYNLQAVPMSIIGVSYSLAAFPILSKFIAEKRQDLFVEKITTALRHVVFWSIPVTVIFIVLRAQIVRTILGAGEFSWNDTRLTAAALALFVVSVAFQNVSLLLIRGYYAAGSTLVPLVINIISAAISIISAYILTVCFETIPIFRFFMEDIMRVNGVSGTSVMILSLAFSISMITNATLLWLYFERVFRTSIFKSVSRTILQSFSASVLMGTTAYLALDFFDNVFDIQTLSGIFLQGLCAGLIGIAVCIGILIVLENPEISIAKKTLHERFWKTKPAVVPDTEVV